jgi:hypothetical protein
MAPLPPVFEKVFTLEVVKVLCFDTDLQVFIVKVLSGAAFCFIRDQLSADFAQIVRKLISKAKKEKVRAKASDSQSARFFSVGTWR